MHTESLAPPGLTLVTLAALVTLWSLVGRRVGRWGVTAPMVFVVAGMVSALFVGRELSHETIHQVAETTLVLVLFHDASTVRLAALRRDPWVAVRLLAIGFPLSVVLTAGVSWWLLPGLGLAGAVVVGASLSATDAGLGAQTILDPVVPMRVRRALNVESGLNDGLATPIVMVALGSLAAATAGSEGLTAETAVDIPSGAWGCVVGLVVGVVLAWVLDRSRSAGWSSPRARGLAVLAVPLVILGASLLVHANAFLAAFLGGLAFGRVARTVEAEPEVSEPLELVSDLLGAVLWFLAGGLAVLSLRDGFDVRWVVVAVLALTVLRLVPVALALLGTGFRRPTVLFIGWFGPRGIATIVFGLLAAQALPDDSVNSDIAGIFSITVLLSVFAHGLSASPLAQRYGRWATRSGDPVAHEPSVEPLPARGRRR